MSFDDLIKVRVPTDLKERLNKVAERRARNPADMIREVLMDMVERHEARQPIVLAPVASTSSEQGGVK